MARWTAGAFHSTAAVSHFFLRFPALAARTCRTAGAAVQWLAVAAWLADC